MSEKKEEQQSYLIRYRVEEWGKPPAEEVRATPHKSINVGEDWSYTDKLFMASIIMDEDGNVSSVLLLDDLGGPNVPRGILELVKQQIEHHLRHHAGPDAAVTRGT